MSFLRITSRPSSSSLFLRRCCCSIPTTTTTTSPSPSPFLSRRANHNDSSSNSNSNNAAKNVDKEISSALRSALPAPGQGEPIVLDVGSGDGSTTVRLDQLGPLVVNHDGSMGRLNNWTEMTRAEQKNTLRILGRRNKQRLEALRAKREKDEGQQQRNSNSGDKTE